MKKIIIIELLLFLGLCFFIYTDFLYIRGFFWYGFYLNVRGLLSIIATITQIATMILVAILNLPAFQPLRDKLTARRTARAEQKAERDKAAKQERIKALESELEELKKDE